MKDNRIKLVVFKGYALAYIFPEQPKSVHMLATSPLKGCPFGSDGSSAHLSNEDDIRLASAEDFEDFRCHFGSFNNRNEYEFAV